MTGAARPACRVCGDPVVKAKGRCATCYVYLRRNGRDRPEHLVVRLTERDVTRELERKAWGGRRSL